MDVEASDFTRNCVNRHPSIWGNLFLQYASHSMNVENNMELKIKVEELKEEVRKMFVFQGSDLTHKLNLIDSIQRLGVSSHFEGEIEEALAKILNTCTNNNKIIIYEDYNLHSLALLFRLFRQQGYPISSEVFNKFKYEDGKFKEEVAKDIEGMLGLYEAAQLRSHGEDILDEALHFTYTHLNSSTNNNQLSPSLAAHVNHCLRQPLHKALLGIVARYYISFYHQHPSNPHEDLLNFAKLDFNMLQRLHQKEVGSLTKWWNESEYVRKIPYVRDRLVEGYFWPLTAAFEPQHSTTRMIMTKLFSMICFLDDTYDSYGTVQELELFTEAINRWDISPIDSLPKCMKVVFDVVQEVYNEMELVITADDKTSSSVMPQIKQAIYELSRAYLVEAKWGSEGYIPSYEEYKENGAISSSIPLVLTSLIGLCNFGTKEVFDWISRYPKVIRASSLIGRLMNDMSTHKFEKERVHVASGVECCVKQYGISEEKAYDVLHNDIVNCWKDINEECLQPHAIPKPVLDICLRMGRLCDFVYENFEDRFTNGELLKQYIVALLVDPIH